MRVDAEFLEYNRINKMNEVSIESELEASDALLVNESVEMESRLERRSFITILKEQDALLDSKNQRILSKQEKIELEKLEKLCREIADTITEKDFKELREQGMNPMKLAPYHLKRLMEDHRDSFEMSSFDLEDEDKFQAEKVLKLAENIKEISMEQIYSLVKKEKEPTIENIYKEQYASVPGKAAEGIKTLDQKSWEELSPYAARSIREAGYPVNEENMEIARDMIERDIPISKSTYKAVMRLKEEKENFSEDKVLSKITESIFKGQDPITTDIISDYENQAKGILEKIHHIDEEAISRVFQSREPITIESLYQMSQSIKEIENTMTSQNKADNQMAYQLQLDRNHKRTQSSRGVKGSATVDDKQDIKDRQDIEDRQDIKDRQDIHSTKDVKGLSDQEITAKRQIEEIRLKMTLEASVKLLKKGFEIDTEKLSHVVNELERLEKESYQEILQSQELEVTTESLTVMSETSQAVNRLSFAPIYLLGMTYDSRSKETLSSLAEQGDNLKRKLMTANSAYETMLTRPEREYHDSIQKAFQNMEPLLTELGIEQTEENQRAVKILAYNEMELTDENINGIKLYDEKVTTLLHHMKPYVTAQLIKEGLNPLEIPVDELNERIEAFQKETGYSEEESYARFLYQLEQKEGISKEDRNAYIGVYRLLRQVEKSDGKALGRVVKAGKEITLKNMLTAIRSERNGQKEYTVDENQGFFYMEEPDGRDILSQIEGSYNNGSYTRQRLSITRLIQKLETLPALNDELLKAYQKTEKRDFVGKDTIWEQLKDIPVDQLDKELTELLENKELRLYQSEVKELTGILKNSDTAMLFLHKLKEPGSAENLMYTSQMFGLLEDDFQKGRKSKNQHTRENISLVLKKTEALTDKLINKVEMASAYENLLGQVQDMLTDEFAQELPDLECIHRLSGIQSRVSYAKRMAARESFDIPLETGESITNMNVTVVRNGLEKGRLLIHMASEEHGEVRMALRLNHETITGHVEGNNRRVLEELCRHSKDLKEVLKAEHIDLKQLSYSYEAHLSENDMNFSLGKSQRDSSQDIERILYRVAKELVKAAAKSYQNL